MCGDWYDLVDLPETGRTAVAVGDVVGHGLRAAGVMGQLRSALSAASRVAGGPAEALEVLGLYARYVDGAESTTAASVFIDWAGRTLTYSSAGHPPPAVCDPQGAVTFLDQATDPRSEPGPNTSPDLRPMPRSPTAPHSSSTPTASSNAARKTSAPASSALPTPRPSPHRRPRQAQRRPLGRPDPSGRPHR